MELMESTQEQELAPPALEAQWGQGVVTTEAWLTPQPCQEGSKRRVSMSSADCTDESSHPCHVPAMASAPAYVRASGLAWVCSPSLPRSPQPPSLPDGCPPGKGSRHLPSDDISLPGSLKLCASLFSLEKYISGSGMLSN